MLVKGFSKLHRMSSLKRHSCFHGQFYLTASEIGLPLATSTTSQTNPTGMPRLGHLTAVPDKLAKAT